jgi:hypothetical protein
MRHHELARIANYHQALVLREIEKVTDIDLLMQDHMTSCLARSIDPTPSN